MAKCSKEKVGVQTLATDTPNCRDAVRAMKLIEIANGEIGKVERYLHRRNQSTDKDTLYFIKFPTHRNLLACNMPEEFKQDSLQVRFSGTIYDFKKQPGPYTLWAPLVLTNIELATK